MLKIGFIGMGNMGFALAKGLLSHYESEDLSFSCHTEEKRISAEKELGIRSAADNCDLVRTSDMIILAIKPQVYADVFAEIKDSVKEGCIFISLAPGKTIDYIKESLGHHVRVVRAMPNTPALIGFGVTGVAYDENEFEQSEIDVIDGIFSSVGFYKKVPEEQISTVTCVSGSSPAYVYMFIDELAKFAESKGLSREDAVAMAAGAVVGAGKMVLETKEEPDVLKSRVCSKGGTTIAGITKLEEMGFSEAIFEGCEACYNRSEELSK